MDGGAGNLCSEGTLGLRTISWARKEAAVCRCMDWEVGLETQVWMEPALGALLPHTASVLPDLESLCAWLAAPAQRCPACVRVAGSDVGSISSAARTCSGCC